MVWTGRHRIAVLAAVLPALLGLGAFFETRTSWLQARYLARQASRLTNEVGAGPSDRIRYPGDGPYDRRLGYTGLPTALRTATGRGYRIAAQVRVSRRFATLVDRGVSPIYQEKTQAGLRVLDRHGETTFASQFPERIYPSVDAIPPAVVRTLLFLENRGLLDPRFPNRNPSVDWPRVARAGADLALRQLGSGRAVPGASTLATQIEKFRHSQEGRTHSMREKLFQMEAAALRSYLGGANTVAARNRIVADYLNSVPLAGIPGYGEVTGLGDGLWAWYGADADEVNRLLWQEARGAAAAGAAPLASRAIAYRQVLSLMLAHRRPSRLLLLAEGREELRALTDRHLRLVARAGIISPALRDAALAVELAPRGRAPHVPRASFIERKIADAVRNELLAVTGVGTLYDLDRLDLTARTTLDRRGQEAVTRLLTRLSDPAFVRAQGLASPRLLERGDPARVTYAVALYERTRVGNVVRIQVDNVDAPFNVNERSRLQLGSTAKLRTLISYLEIVEQLHGRHAGQAAARLRSEPVGADDGITAWTLAYLAADPGATLERTLDAAMARPYSASPGEGLADSGRHAFRNLDPADDLRAVPVREAFIRSVNLPFVRILRDVVRYHSYRLPGGAHLLLDTPAEASPGGDEPRPRVIVHPPDDGEARAQIARFYRTLTGADSASVLDNVGRGRAASQLAWAYRSVTPQGGLAGFGTFFRRHTAGPFPSAARIADLYDRSDPAGFSIADRGRLAGVHPLDLWLAAYLCRHPDAGQPEAYDASAAMRREVAAGRQRSRGRTALEQWSLSIPEAEAFREVHRSWRRLGYPFASLAPSYATALGSSADRPDQLAELAGIVLAGGMRYPVRRVDELHFAAGTPFETLLRPVPERGERVLSSAVAAVVRDVMIAVVAQGTARRVNGAVRAADGEILLIGAKTGTGNNRIRVYGEDGLVIEDRAADRTASVVFFVGDRFYGTITAFVSGAASDRYGFTSALPVHILRMMGPTLEAMMRRDAGPVLHEATITRTAL